MAGNGFVLPGAIVSNIGEYLRLSDVDKAHIAEDDEFIVEHDSDIDDEPKDGLVLVFQWKIKVKKNGVVKKRQMTKVIGQNIVMMNKYNFRKIESISSIFIIAFHNHYNYIQICY